MKKLFACLFLVQLCKLYGSQNNNTNHLPEVLDIIQLPTAEIIQRRLAPFFLPDFFTKTPILPCLANKTMPKKDVVKVFNTHVEAYFKQTDQPAGRKFFARRKKEVESLLLKNTPPQESHLQSQSTRDFVRLYQIFDGKRNNTLSSHL